MAKINPDPGNGDKQRGKAKNRAFDEQYAAARVLYESRPDMMVQSIADECGISIRALQCRMKRDSDNGDPWNRKLALDVGEQALALAEKYQGKLEDYGPELTPDNRRQAVRDLAVEQVTEMRAQLIERHRREWGAVRSMVYDGIKKREYGDVAKLAKISAETLQIIQSNERKAWGIDKPSGDSNTSVTVVIERE